MHRTSILVVDDDPSINEILQRTLEGEGWKTFSAFNGDEAIKSIHKNAPDLVILDIMMPGIDSIEVCRHILNTTSVPVVMLSALDNLENKVKCLSLGADDYITKPFRTEELIARVRAVLHRHQENPAGLRTSFISGDLEINFNARRVIVKGREIRLTSTEYRLLAELTINAGKVLTYRYLLNEVWGPEYSDERQYLHVYIGHLRNKIESNPENPTYIVTIPGVGYRFDTRRGG